MSGPWRAVALGSRVRHVYVAGFIKTAPAAADNGCVRVRLQMDVRVCAQTSG